MKTKTLIITLILAAVILVPLALAVPKGGPRGGQGQGGQVGQRGQGQGAQRGQGQGAMARTRDPRGGDFAQMLLGRMSQELNLSNEQKEKIKAISKKSGAEAQKSRKVVYEAMQVLNEAAEEGTEAKIIAAGKSVGEAMTQQALEKAAVIKIIKAELSKEQLTKLAESQAKMKERIQQMVQDRGQRGEGDASQKRGSKAKADRKPKGQG